MDIRVADQSVNQGVYGSAEFQVAAQTNGKAAEFSL